MLKNISKIELYRHNQNPLVDADKQNEIFFKAILSRSNTLKAWNINLLALNNILQVF